jgi:hypothetical protein
MMAKPRFWILAGLAIAATIVILYFITVFTSGPVLYTLEKDTFPSRFHDNTDALKAQSLNATTDVLPLMQDLLDYSGPVVLNIRLKDYDQARRDLATLTQNNQKLNNLIVRLDMNESEIRDFSRSTARQKDLLEGIMNSSVALDKLENMEIQYREQGNQGGLVSVQLQGDAIRKKMVELTDDYREETKKVMKIGSYHGADITPADESLHELDTLVQETSASGQRTELPFRRSAQLSFLIYPSEGKYGDVIEGSGSLYSIYGNRMNYEVAKNVTIYLDDRPLSTVKTDATGSFSLQVPIERIPAGTHSLYAESGISESEFRDLKVIAVDSVTTLTVGKPGSRGDVTCTGSVTANRPVRLAPVDIIVDGKIANTTLTTKTGTFTAKVRLNQGSHTIIARFMGEEYPIRPSESAPQLVNVSIPFNMPEISIVPLFVALLILGLFAFGARSYLMRHRKTPVSTGPIQGPVAPLPEPSAPLPAPTPEDLPIEEDTLPAPTAATAISATLLDRYTTILGERGLSAAARSAYLDLSGRVATDLHIPRHTALTPREVSQSCRKMPYCKPFASFVRVYERVRYGGYASGTVQEELVAEMKNTASRMDGEDH